MTDDEITCRIRRTELLGLLHEPGAQDRITARMPAVTLAQLLVVDEAPPELPITFRPPAGTGRMPRLDDGAVADDIEPELSHAISRVTSQATIATIEAAIDAAVAERVSEIDPSASLEDTAAASIFSRARRRELVPMFLGFAITLIVGLALMLAI